MKNGKLIISLDFELLWGVFDKVDFKEKGRYFNNTRNIIPEILILFEKYSIHCTWATVGMIFNKNWEDWKKNIPDFLPNYEKQILCAYTFADNNKNKKILNEMCFAPDLISKIGAVPFQEIGSHTYSHYYCLENGQTAKSFKSDLEKNILMGKKYGFNITSLVLPRNQFNPNYVNICYELGITSIRTNPTNWYWDDTSKDSILKKIFRTGDAYFGKLDKIYVDDEILDEVPYLQKSSRLFRPHTSNRLLNNLKLNRIRKEMEIAAKENKIYHLWWHPHNFGNNPKENLRDLETLLKYYRELNLKYNFSSLNMKELSEISRGRQFFENQEK